MSPAAGDGAAVTAAGSATVRAAGAGRDWARLGRDIRRNRNAYLFIAPFFTMFALFMAFPIALSLRRSFQSWNGIMAPKEVGLANYREALADPGLLNALANTLIFAVVTVTLSVALGLGLALFLNSVRVMKRFFRAIFFIPAVVSLVVVSLVWKLILNSEVGLARALVEQAGLALAGLTGATGPPVWSTGPLRLLDSPDPTVQLLSMTLVNVWAVVGFNTVIFLAGLQGIPRHLYEASRIDGATSRQDFRHITLPLLRPTMFFVVLMSTIDAMQVFVLPRVMNRDSDATMTIVYYLYQNAFEYQKMGYASAIAYLLFGLTVALGLAVRATLGRESRWVGAE